MVEEKRTTIAVIGLGPVGSILAGHLAKYGQVVVVEDIMEKLLTTIKNEGIHISGITQVTAKIENTANSMTELAEFDPEIVFIVTKACYLKNVLTEMKNVYTPKMKIVSFQNGLDNERLIKEHLGIDTTYRVVINFAGNLIGPGKARMHWFQPPNYIGAFHKGEYTIDGTTRKIAEILSAADLETKETPFIKRKTWEKTILNSALCSICAVTGQTMREAMEFTYSRSLAIEILREGLAVAKEDGHDFGENALDRFASYLEKGGAHKPSMLVDIENKRSIEIDFMSGAIVRYGEKYGIPTPVNSTLTSLLKTIENQYSNP
ncbi:MAG: ketopantoate reductase family protein [Candidatus Bathyarchaeota archaeon]|nr:MAG: ketopantoate reductase family protein [Candidatus Bathyarchaeota archaeon]